MQRRHQPLGTRQAAQVAGIGLTIRKGIKFFFAVFIFMIMIGYHITESIIPPPEKYPWFYSVCEELCSLRRACDGSGASVSISKANVTIDGQKSELDVSKGKINLGKLPAGEHAVVVSVNDGFHKIANASLTAKVNPISGRWLGGSLCLFFVL